MSTAAASTSSLYQQLQTYFQTRQSDLKQLGQDLQNNDLTDAQQEFSAIQTLGQSGPFANGDAFQRTDRQQDFSALGQALQSGSLANAQQAFQQLESTFQPAASSTPAPVTAPAPSSTGSGNEIVINLGNVTPGEQITIGVNNESNGQEQLTISLANPQSSSQSQNQNQNPQITLNLNANANANEEIILNLFSSAAPASTGTTVNTAA